METIDPPLAPTAMEPTEVDGRVLVAVFGELKTSSRRPGGYLVLMRQTLSCCDRLFGVPEFPCVPTDALVRIRETEPTIDQSFHIRNAQSVALPDFREGDAVRYLDAPGVGVLEGKDFWPSVRSRFPNARGYLFVSLPGYSEDGQRALVYLDLSYGGFDQLGGYSALYKLVLLSGHWQVDDKELISLS